MKTTKTAPWIFITWNHYSGTTAAVVWKKRGSEKDIAKAHEYAKTFEGGRVHLGTAKTSFESVRAAHRTG